MKTKLFTGFGLFAAAAIGVLALTAPLAVASCQPVACPAIGILCPDGDVACRVSPCNCKQVCVPEDKCR